MKFLKKIVKKSLSTPLFLSVQKGKKIILLYHDISNPQESSFSAKYSTSVENFQNQISVLKKYFSFIPVDELLLSSGDSKKNYASIVFDDGFFSVYKNAFPFLLKEKIPFKIFVNKKAILENRLWVSDLELNKNNKPFLTQYYEKNINKTQTSLDNFLNDPFNTALSFNSYPLKDIDSKSEETTLLYCDKIHLNKMLQSGLVSISSHSYNHYVLSSCDKELLISEIQENKMFLESLGVKNDLHFAIPFGNKRHYNEDVISVLKNNGYRYIHTTNPNCLKHQKGHDNIRLIPRIGIYLHTMEEIFFMINQTFLFNFDL